MPRIIDIVCVVDNNAAGRGLLAEHGLSMWITLDSSHVLFDTGQGLALPINIRQLRVPLERADAIVLSHGHYDHTGGLEHALAEAPDARVYCHPEALSLKYSMRSGARARYIGMADGTRAALTARPRLSVPCTAPTEVISGLIATGPIPRQVDFESGNGHFFRDAHATAIDPLTDDQALFCDTAEGVVVLLGCTHAGIINTLTYIDQLTGGRPIAAIIGGMHLHEATPERVRLTVRALNEMGVKYVAPAHCTGWDACVELSHAFGPHCQPCYVGRKFTFAMP